MSDQGQAVEVINDPIAAQQMPIKTAQGFLRQDIDIPPKNHQDVYNHTRDIEWEFRKAENYHMINLNKSMMYGYYVVKLRRANGNVSAINIQFPWNAIFVWDQTQAKQAEYAIYDLKEYGRWGQLLSFFRDEDKIVDAPTWRLPVAGAAAVTIAGNVSSVVVPLVNTRSLAITWNAGPSIELNFKVPVWIPIYSTLENAGNIPIYQLATPLRMIYRLKAPKDILKFTGFNNMLVDPAGSGLSDLFINTETLQATNQNTSLGGYLNPGPVTWKGVETEVLIKPLTLSPVTRTRVRIEWQTLWKNMKSICHVAFTKEDPTNVNWVGEDKGLDRMPNRNIFYSPIMQDDADMTTYISKIASYNYPTQSPIEHPFLAWKQCLVFLNQFDDNGIDRVRFMNFITWATTKGFMAIDYSLATQMPGIISGVNTLNTNVVTDMMLKRDRNAAVPAAPYEYDMYNFIQRNVIYRLENGTIMKIE